MDTIIVDVKNPIEVRKAALRVLNKHLGPEVTKAFMGQSLYRSGDFTAEKKEREPISIDELFKMIMEEEAKMDQEEKDGQE